MHSDMHSHFDIWKFVGAYGFVQNLRGFQDMQGKEFYFRFSKEAHDCKLVILTSSRVNLPNTLQVHQVGGRFEGRLWNKHTIDLSQYIRKSHLTWNQVGKSCFRNCYKFSKWSLCENGNAVAPAMAITEPRGSHNKSLLHS